MNVNMESLANESIEFLRGLVKGEDKPDNAKLKIARIASASISSYVALLRHEHNQERTALRFAQLLYNGNSEDLASYMRAALPTAGFVVATDAVAKPIASEVSTAR